MVQEIIGVCPSTGEVAVHDTETGEYYWAPGTPDQVNEVYEALKDQPEVYPGAYPEYEEPTPPYKPPPPPPKQQQRVYIPPLAPKALKAAEGAATTGGYFGAEALNWIIVNLNELSSHLYNAYTEILSWVWPFWYAAEPFYLASSAVSSIAWGFYAFGEWVRDVADKLPSILDWDTIWSYIESYVPNLTQIGDWFYSWVTNVTQLVTDWWDTTKSTVLGWVNEAKQWAKALIDSVESKLGSLQSAWSVFVVGTLPKLADWSGVDALIKSWFNDFTPFWQGWQDWRDKVIEFFTDPDEWLYKAMDRIIERFW